MCAEHKDMSRYERLTVVPPSSYSVDNMRKKVFRPVTTPTLKDHVLELLADAIVSGKIRPGERLKELDLARQLHVSRAPIREALSRLQEQGLAVRRPRRGLLVVSLGQEEIQMITS